MNLKMHFPHSHLDYYRRSIAGRAISAIEKKFVWSTRSPENLFKSFEVKSIGIKPTRKARLDTQQNHMVATEAAP